jgi:hypothetical protein
MMANDGALPAHPLCLCRYRCYVHQVPLMRCVPLARRVMERLEEHVDVATKYLGYLCNVAVSSSNQVRWRRAACARW